jgi:hypothetical protein
MLRRRLSFKITVRYKRTHVFGVNKRMILRLPLNLLISERMSLSALTEIRFRYESDRFNAGGFCADNLTFKV